MWVYVLEMAIIRGAMAPLAPPLTRPLVLSKAKHCQAVLSKAKHWHAVMSEVPFKTSTPFKKKIKTGRLMLFSFHKTSRNVQGGI